MKLLSAFSFVIVSFLSISQEVQATELYTYTQILYPGSTPTQLNVCPPNDVCPSRAASINDKGQIVGTYMWSPGFTQGYVKSGSTYTSISPFSAPFTTLPGLIPVDIFPTGINNHGQILGYFITGSLILPYVNPQGFLMRGSSLTLINFPGAIGTIPSGVNDRGQIIGAYISSTGTEYPFEDIKGVFNTIKLPDGRFPDVTGINDLGQIVGEGLSPDGFIDTNGHFVPIKVPKGTVEFYPIGINKRDQILGVATIFPDVTEYVVDTNGKFGSPINVPGAALTFATGINDQGQVVGWDLPVSGTTTTYGFLATPVVPEPSTWILMATGLVGLIGWAGYRRIKARA